MSLLWPRYLDDNQGQNHVTSKKTFRIHVFVPIGMVNVYNRILYNQVIKLYSKV